MLDGVTPPLRGSSLEFLGGLDWIEQCFTSPPTQFRLYGRRFLQVVFTVTKFYNFWVELTPQ